MSKIIGIVAISQYGLMAIDGDLPWDVKEDLQFFKANTLNSTVLMGRKTWDSIGRKCLSNRNNYIITREGTFSTIANTCAIVFSDINKAIEDSQIRYPNNNIFIMGGNSIYSQTLPIWDEMYLTIIKDEYITKDKEGTRLYLDIYPSKLGSFMEEVSSRTTEYATYKKYQRKVISKFDKERIIYS